MRRLNCSDLGFACDHWLERENDEELIRAAEEHVRLEHGVELDEDARGRLVAAIRDA
jgi:predicted small metal-binding protein